MSDKLLGPNGKRLEINLGDERHMIERKLQSLYRNCPPRWKREHPYEKWLQRQLTALQRAEKTMSDIEGEVHKARNPTGLAYEFAVNRALNVERERLRFSDVIGSQLKRAGSQSDEARALYEHIWHDIEVKGYFDDAHIATVAGFFGHSINYRNPLN